MKKIYLLLVLGLLLFISGCADDVTDFTYEDSGITIGGDTIYYREYTVSTSCDSFDVFLAFEEGEYYYYTEDYSSMSGSCSSGFYVSDSGEYIELRYAYSIGVYDSVQLDAVTWGITFYQSNIIPSEATLAALIIELNAVGQDDIFATALQVEYAAKLYCSQTTCSSTETLTWLQIQPYTIGITTSDYDLTNNGGIIASKSDGVWEIDLERVGTGEWEFTEGLTPSIDGISAVIIDTD